MRFTIILILALSITGCSRKKEIVVLFNNVEGLGTYSPVTYNGVNVGSVSKFDLTDTMVAVTVSLDKHIDIPKGSKFVFATGLIGTHIEIQPSQAIAYLNYKDTVLGEINKEFSLTTVITDTAKRRKAEASFKKMAEGMNEILQTMAEDQQKGNEK